MINHWCSADSSEVNTTLSLSYISINFYVYFMHFRKKQNQQIFSLVIFNFYKLNN
jgi:hypothetical protein